MVINTNVGALSTMRTLTESTSNNKALSRLASGSKIVNLPMMQPVWLLRTNSMRRFRVIVASQTT